MGNFTFSSAHLFLLATLLVGCNGGGGGGGGGGGSSGRTGAGGPASAPAPTTADTTNPSPATSVSLKDSICTFQWTAPSDADINRYEVAVSTDQTATSIVAGYTFSKAPVAFNGIGTTAQWSPNLLLSLSTDYYFLIKAVDHSGNKSTLATTSTHFWVTTTDPATVTCVGPSLIKPIDQTETGDEDVNLNFTLNSATVTATNDTVKYAIVTAPATGTLTNCMDLAGSTGAGDVTCTYLGPLNVYGVAAASFTYRVYTDQTILMSDGDTTVTINLDPINDAPVLIAPTNRLYPFTGTNDPIKHDNNNYFETLISDVDGDAFTSSCTYKTIGLHAADPNAQAAALDCNNLMSFTSVSGQISIKNGFSGDMNLADNTELSVGDVDLTIAIWVKPTNLTNGTGILGKWSGANDEYSILYTGSRFQFSVQNSASTQTDVIANNFGAPNNGSWHLIIAEHNASTDTISIKVNNGATNSLAHADGIRDGTNAFAVGTFIQGDNGKALSGDYSTLAFWKRVLTSDEMTAIYNSGFGLKYGQYGTNLKTNLEAVYQFDIPGNLGHNKHGVFNLNVGANIKSNQRNARIIDKANFFDGVLRWRPIFTQMGTYEFTVTADDGTITDSTTFYTSIQPSYGKANMVGSFDSHYTEGSTGILVGLPVAPRLDGTANDDKDTWLSLGGSNGDISGFNIATPWLGNGLYNTPYSLNFSGVSDEMDLGTPFSGMNRIGFSMWIRPSDASLTDKIILGNGGETGNGFVLKQSSVSSGKLAFIMGNRNYQAIVNSLDPYVYYRLGEGVGPTAINSAAGASTCGGACNLTYNGSILGGAGGIEGDANTSANFDGDDDLNAGNILNLGAYTKSVWVKLNGGVQNNVISGVDANGHVLWIPAAGGGRVKAGHNGAWSTLASPGPLPNGVWHHIAVSYDSAVAGGTLKLFLNGKKVDMISGYAAPTSSGTYIGAYNGGNFFTGDIDEVAIFNRALSEQDIKKLGYICYSEEKLMNGEWANVAGFYDGTDSVLMINGKIQCAVDNSGALANGVTNLFLGGSSAGTKSFQGEISEFQFFARSDATNAIDTTGIQEIFNYTADKYRSTTLEGLVTKDMIYLFDPANNIGKTKFSGIAAADCSNLDRLARDTTKNSNDGVLFGLDTCNTFGWQGVGTPASPYRLSLDGIGDYVKIPNDQIADGLNAFSFSVWLKPVNVPFGSFEGIFSRGNGSQRTPWIYGWQGQRYATMNIETVSGGANDISINSDNLTAGNWQHLVFTWDGTFAFSYLNGVKSINNDTSTGNTIAVSGWDAFLGYINGLDYFEGDMGPMIMYRTNLNDAEVRQNCLAQEGRFTAVPQSICAAP
ncbi:MAG: hypothetical protein HOE90_23165 [Bacteriovoracaceae bacterium]|jgi:hypothetical protein|nr:hypothetical protein [Bacteriovoracaceae bacterium]